MSLPTACSLFFGFSLASLSGSVPAGAMFSSALAFAELSLASAILGLLSLVSTFWLASPDLASVDWGSADLSSIGLPSSALEHRTTEGFRRMQQNAVQRRISAVRCEHKSLGINALILVCGDGSFIKYCELCPADTQRGCAPASHQVKETFF